MQFDLIAKILKLGFKKKINRGKLILENSLTRGSHSHAKVWSFTFALLRRPGVWSLHCGQGSQRGSPRHRLSTLFDRMLYFFERLIVDSSDDEIYSCIWDTRKTVKTYISNETLLLLYISFCNNVLVRIWLKILRHQQCQYPMVLGCIEIVCFYFFNLNKKIWRKFQNIWRRCADLAADPKSADKPKLKS